MINIKNKSKCAGCFSCEESCPKNCIKMVKDKEGFLYPKIDKKNCINCGLCEKKCPVNNTSNTPFDIAYACYSNDDNIRMQSSSGGLFTVFSNYILKNNGIIYGARFSKDYKRVYHARIDNINDLNLLRRSKYVQSEIGDTYKQAEKDLINDKLVYFSGTPCQIAGLKKYLSKEYQNLITQDCVCFGVPSPLAWEKNILEKEKKFNDVITNVNLREKTNGWHDCRIEYDSLDKKEYKIYSQDRYMQGFFNKISIRPICYDCQFKCGNSGSDITLADFWGIEKILPQMDNNKGTSLLLINTDKGVELFNKIKNDITFNEVDKKIAITNNPFYSKSIEKPNDRKKFFKRLKKMSLEESVKKADSKKNVLLKRLYIKCKIILRRIFK